ncbi:rim15, signal transduction response regulator [Gnomoniopsis smithogilvyi]|uniref:non-specific serine/threonine protein kinase n=1 Tax=Gnomoniopsis smithogilvyi TaxID=1191159 RepID=A0A9W8Z0S5_9PEZI|nr:rim15, signal transduction response regulator [Gnomoniopsis smithogilvyi]
MATDPTMLAPPAVTSLRAQTAGAMERTFSQDIREEREDLKEAAEQTLNVIVDLNLDGTIRWVSPSWIDVIGTQPDDLKDKHISDVVVSEPTSIFTDVVESLQGDDSRSQFIRFCVKLGPLSKLLVPRDDARVLQQTDDAKETATMPQEKPEAEMNQASMSQEEPQVVDLEAQGIMVHDTGGESHVMWMIRPWVAPREIKIEMDPELVDSLGSGAQVLAGFLTHLAETSVDDPAYQEPPSAVLCRICERQIPGWWFEKHTDLCLQEHQAEMEVQLAQESLAEHRHAIVKVLDALEVRKSRSISGEQQTLPLAEYKGMPIGPPASNSSSPGTASPSTTGARSRERSSGFGHARARSFAVRRPQARIVELLLDLCDTSMEISTPAIKDSSAHNPGEFRTQSPQSESRISQVMQWQSPSNNTLEQEQGLALLCADTERIAKAKVDAVFRHRKVIEYAERIRVEFAIKVQDCIDDAVDRAARIAAGRLSDSSESEVEAGATEEGEAPLEEDVEVTPVPDDVPDEDGIFSGSFDTGNSLAMALEKANLEDDPDKRQFSAAFGGIGAPPMARAVPPSIKDFEVIKPISKGAFGSVYLSKKKSTGEYFAIKVLKKADMVAKNQVTNVKAERAIMMWQGESDFVAKLYWTFSSKDYLYLVMEYLNGGDCASLIKVLGGLPEDWVKKYLGEVVLGVEHLHSRGIVHRDLKPDNLLIDQKGHLKLTDFGLSRMGLVGRQTRALHPGATEPAPDLLKSGPFARSLSIGSSASRSTSLDVHQPHHSPALTPQMTPSDFGHGIGQPSYFSLGPASHEPRRISSSHRSDSGGSETLTHMLGSFSLNDSQHSSVSQAIASPNEGSEGGSPSPDIGSLRHTSTTSTQSGMEPGKGTPPQPPMPPPNWALFDPEDTNRRFVGTPDYLAPETIRGEPQDETSDWWSVGCILYEFLYGIPPFHASEPEQVFENILARRLHWPPEDQDEVSSGAKDLINKLLCLDPKERLGCNKDGKFASGGEEIRSHLWLHGMNWETLLEDEAQFVPQPENLEDTEYFDARGATLQSFAEEMEDQMSPPVSAPAADYPDRPHDALSRVRSQVNSIKRGLMPLHIPPHVRDLKSRRLSEPTVNDDFGSFAYKNLPVLDKANKDVIQKLRAEALAAQNKHPNVISPGGMSQVTSPGGSAGLEGSPILGNSGIQRTLSTAKASQRPQSPSGAKGSPVAADLLARHRNRRSQVFDMSPSSSDNEGEKANAALLRVQRRRQSSRRMSQIACDTPTFRALDVLICEDHPVSRMVMEKLLEKLRCRTISASTGPEAVRYAMSDIKFDIIFMEFKLPQIIGADVAKMIRETKNANSHTPIVAITAYLKELQAPHYFDSLIEKPISSSKLTEVLTHFCQWKTASPVQSTSMSLAMAHPAPSSLRQESLKLEDSPTSGTSSAGFAMRTGSSFRGSSREDSISSVFGDSESQSADDVPVVISHKATSGDWEDHGLGIGLPEEEHLLSSNDTTKELTPLALPTSASAKIERESVVAPMALPQPRRSFEKLRAKRELMEKRRLEGSMSSIDSADDEDDELGLGIGGQPVGIGPITAAQASKQHYRSKSVLPSSKLGIEMMRANSHDSMNVPAAEGAGTSEPENAVLSNFSNEKGSQEHSPLSGPSLLPPDLHAGGMSLSPGPIIIKDNLEEEDRTFVLHTPPQICGQGDDTDVEGTPRPPPTTPPVNATNRDEEPTPRPPEKDPGVVIETTEATP